METIYDKCAYQNCRNGRYSTGTHLFRFPKKETRQKLWIRNSGKFCIFLSFIYFKSCYMNQWWHSSPCQSAHTNVFPFHLHRDVLFTSSSIHVTSSSPKLRKCIAALWRKHHLHNDELHIRAFRISLSFGWLKKDILMENYWNIIGLTKKQFEVFGKHYSFQ